jgi:copper chaperone CopZ
MSDEVIENASDSCRAACAAGSKAGALGTLSAILASACCGLPLLLLAVGLGGLGLGSLLGRYHWYFTGAGAVLLAAAWFVFVRERSRLRAAGSEIRHAGLTPALLAVASAAVVGFGGLNAASALGLGSKAREVRNAVSHSYGEVAQVVLHVEGMTCVTCEWSIEKALAELKGVADVQASASEHKVLVRYEPGKVSLQQMIDAVDSAGYRAATPGAP